MKVSRVILGLIALAVGLIGWWVVANFELRDDTTTLGPTKAARQDPYLAAERLVQDLGVPTEGFQSIAAVPDSSMSVYLGGDRAGFVGRRQDDLVQWVEAGGHLILVIQKPGHSDAWKDKDVPVIDELLTRLGITAYPNPGSAEEILSTPLPGDASRTVEIEMEPVVSLTCLEEPLFDIKDSGDNMVLLSIQRGFGRVTAIAQDDWVTNAKIADHGHATMFWELVNQGGVSGLWVVRGDQVPGFLRLLGRHAWPALAAFGLLVILWMLRAGLRFGPLLDTEESERRSLLEHLDAAGRFLWRCHAYGPMLRSVRSGLVREIGRRRPAWVTMGDTDKVARLAELSDLSKARVRSALLADDIEDNHGFVLAVKDLKKMESNL